jgi:hypothetical protein
MGRWGTILEKLEISSENSIYISRNRRRVLERMQVHRGLVLFWYTKVMKVLHLGHLLVQLGTVTDDFPFLLRSDYLQLYWCSYTRLIEAREPSMAIVGFEVRIYVNLIVFGIYKAV